MNTLKITIVLLMAILVQVNAQEHTEHSHSKAEGNGFRIAGVIGHTLVNNEGMDNIFVPSWGIDFEYWFNDSWGVGFHNDIELETFIIRTSSGQEIERVNPLVLTLDALYQFGGGFVVTLGPGVELEKDESFYLIRVGIEYEKNITNTIYLLPNLFLDQRFDGYNTWNVGLGIGLKL